MPLQVGKSYGGSAVMAEVELPARLRAQDGERIEGWVWLNGHCGQHTFYPKPDFAEPEHHHGTATLILHPGEP